MPDPTGTKNNGGLVFGSQVFTIGTGEDEQTFIAEAFSLSAGANRLASMNQHGVENKQVFIATTPNGDATLQLADEDTVPPAQFAEFTATLIGGGTVTLIITEVGQAFTNNGETKLTIKVFKKLT
ncbi:MAG: hypothetical protein V4710_00750 [Verrucomicrobiota bacterium]